MKNTIKTVSIPIYNSKPRHVELINISHPFDTLDYAYSTNSSNG
jgi:hypothetical protein